jgi:outer membrane immunogenic protein
VAPTSWTGFYLGGGVGLRSTIAEGSTASATNNGVPLGNAPGFGCPTPGPGCATETLNNTALRGSGYLGYNWQLDPRWVVGVEGDLGSADASTTLRGFIYPGGGAPFYITGRIDDVFVLRTTWDADVRGRLGYLVTPTALLYVTGGAAWQHIEATSTCGSTNSCTPGGFGPGVISDRTTRPGWTFGGGIETVFAGNWLARAEYRFADYGTVTNTDSRVFPGGPITQTASYNINLVTHTAVFGLAYKFGDPISNASAAVMPVKAPPIAPSWAGYYVGAGVGMRSWIAPGSMVAATNNGVPLANFAGFGCATPGPGCATESINGSEIRGSGHVGYNWQPSPQWLLGIEGEFGSAGQEAKNTGILYPGGGVVFYLTGRADDAFSVKPTWDTSVRGRLGYLATPSLLVYATGGAAWQQVEMTAICGSISCRDQRPSDRIQSLAQRP